MLEDESTLDSAMLYELHLFQGLDIQVARDFLNHAEHHLLPKGEILLSPRTNNGALYVVLSGLLSVHLDSPNSDLIATINVGECAGEMSLFDEGTPSAYVVAADDSRILKMSGDMVWGMIDNCEGFAKNFLHLTASRMRTSNRTMSNSRRIQQHYESRANIDSLTRLHNRRWIDQNLPQAFETCVADKIPLCLMLIDIDGFKKYNDDNGHLAGDTCLKTVAEAIRISIRPSDLLGRFGGEEFVILLPDTKFASCESIAIRIKDEVENAEVTGHKLEILPSVTISIGVTENKANTIYEDIFKAADKALYRAKASGRNCICYEE
jgi:diguanylate cyclase (GGDEF)-like protein